MARRRKPLSRSDVVDLMPCPPRRRGDDGPTRGKPYDAAAALRKMAKVLARRGSKTGVSSPRSGASGPP